MTYQAVMGDVDLSTTSGDYTQTLQGLATIDTLTIEDAQQGVMNGWTVISCAAKGRLDQSLWTLHDSVKMQIGYKVFTSDTATETKYHG